MPLTNAAVGEVNIIKDITGSSETRRLLESLGFVAGGSVVLIHILGDNYIFTLDEERVAVSAELAGKIEV